MGKNRSGIVKVHPYLSIFWWSVVSWGKVAETEELIRRSVDMMNSLQRTPPAQLLTLDDIANHFSVPLSDAANNLGVCVSVLKKICRDSGLDRWPYRKFLAGKSIEDIKKHAARERNKGLAEIAKAGKQSGSQPQSIENSKSQGETSPNKLLQPGGKDTTLSIRQHVILPQPSKSLLGVDEFKNGFPSIGLSIITNKWWGSGRPDECEDTDGDGDGAECKSQEKTEDSPSLISTDVEVAGEGKLEGVIAIAIGKEEGTGTGLLSAVRKRRAEEGREALKIGSYKKFGVDKVGRKERALLLGIFGAEQWMSSAC